MKKAIYYISVSMLLIFTGCLDREILESKPGDPIESVTNLQYSINGTAVTLTWSLPSDYPDDIVQPVSVLVRVIREGVTLSNTTTVNAPTSFVYNSYDNTRKYTVIVKVIGSVDTTDPNVSNLRYSLGSSVSF